MESDLVSGSLSLLGEDKSLETNLSLITYTEQFYSHLPFYLSIGMTYEQYWNEDCCLVKYYRKAHEIRQDRLNEQLWLQGLYVYEAFIDVAPAFRSMGTKPPEKYRAEPLPRTSAQVEKQVENEKKTAYDDGFMKMKAFTATTNQKFREKEG